MTENEISKVVVEAAIEVHRALGGPGLLESLYEEALAYELELRGLTVERQRLRCPRHEHLSSLASPRLCAFALRIPATFAQDFTTTD